MSRKTPQERVATALALWFGCGLVPIAPGTAGSLGAIPLYLWIRPAGLWAVLAAAVVITAVGVWSSGIVARLRKQKDPQVVVIDEVAGMLVTLLAAPIGWKGTLCGFVAFRICDQFKPWPARAAERLPGGWGIVMDDVLAGVWAAGMLLAARYLGWL